MTATSIVVGKPDGYQFINANDRTHWARKARMTAAWRQAAAWQAKAAGLPSYGDRRVRITCIVHKATNRKYDVGNLSGTAKACIDGLRDAGVLDDDDNAHVIGPDMRAGDKALQTHIVIRIEEESA